MIPPIDNLLVPHLSPANAEQFRTLLETGQFRLEHIVSHGASSPANYWYDQDDNEWVMLLQGTATLQFETGATQLRAGDALLIPAHQKHRVQQCSHDAIWLALHFT